jgi:hypothetical protein
MGGKGFKHLREEHDGSEVFNLLQDDQDAGSMFSATGSTHSRRTGSLDISSTIRVLDTESFRVEEQGEWCSDERQDEGDDYKGREELVIDDTGGKTDIEDDDLDKTDISGVL